jgi:hypothetical protein
MESRSAFINCVNPSLFNELEGDSRVGGSGIASADPIAL